MSRSAQFLVALALFGVFAASAVSALNCFECLPNPDKDCDDRSQFKSVTCDKGDNPYCRKMIQNVQGKVNYVLQCAYAEGGMEKPYYNTANDYVKANVYHCDKDECNSAVSVGASKIAAVAVLAIAWMLH